MIKLLNSWCTRCSEAGAHLDHFLLHINARYSRHPIAGRFRTFQDAKTSTDGPLFLVASPLLAPEHAE